MRDLTLNFVVGATVSALLCAWNWLFIKRSSSILQKWAAGQGYEILHSEISMGAPFNAAALSFWSASHGQLVYRVTLRDRVGLKRSALASCGRFVRGVFSRDEVKVTWNDETAA